MSFVEVADSDYAREYRRPGQEASFSRLVERGVCDESTRTRENGNLTWAYDYT